MKETQECQALSRAGCSLTFFKLTPIFVDLLYATSLTSAVLGPNKLVRLSTPASDTNCAHTGCAVALASAADPVPNFTDPGPKGSLPAEAGAFAGR